MNIKEQLKKIDALKARKKELSSQVDEVQAEIDSLTEEINQFANDNVDENGVYENDDVIIVKSVKTKKKIILLKVLENEEARERLISSLRENRCSGSITIKFEKDLLGIENYTDYLEMTPEEKIEVSLKEGR